MKNMSRKNKKKGGQTQSLSLRDQIKAYRRDLHGDVAQSFDEGFCEIAGEYPIKKALSAGKELQKAFVAGKNAAQAMMKKHPIVQPPNLLEEDD